MTNNLPSSAVQLESRHLHRQPMVHTQRVYNIYSHITLSCLSCQMMISVLISDCLLMFSRSHQTVSLRSAASLTNVNSYLLLDLYVVPAPKRYFCKGEIPRITTHPFLFLLNLAWFTRATITHKRGNFKLADVLSFLYLD